MFKNRQTFPASQNIWVLVCIVKKRMHARTSITCIVVKTLFKGPPFLSFSKNGSRRKGIIAEKALKVAFWTKFYQKLPCTKFSVIPHLPLPILSFLPLEKPKKTLVLFFLITKSFTIAFADADYLQVPEMFSIFSLQKMTKLHMQSKEVF